MYHLSLMILLWGIILCATPVRALSWTLGMTPGTATSVYASVGATIVLCILISVLCRIRDNRSDKKRKKAKEERRKVREQKKLEMQKVKESSDYKIQQLGKITDIEIKEKLGSGQFGEVYKGMWQGVTPCALKKLKKTEFTNEFFEEASMLSKMDSPTIVRFFGIYQDKDKYLFLVTEFMGAGALNNFLRDHKKDLSLKDLVLLARDAAAGMVFVSSKGVIHRDLAARNLLVKQEDNRYTAKVADFGMSRFLTESEYYKASNNTFPVKWSAPEVLQYEKFSTKSDVWSFGVVLWEIFEFGAVPFPGKSNNEAMTMVLDGQRLPRPELCPESLYQLMLQCWATNAEDRPSFEFIYNRLHALAQELGATAPAPTAMQIVSGESKSAEINLYNTASEFNNNNNTYNTAPPTSSKAKKFEEDDEVEQGGPKIEIYNNGNNNSNYTTFQNTNDEIYNS